MLCKPLNPMVLLIIIPIKWLFHWEYTQHFQTNPYIVSNSENIGFTENALHLNSNRLSSRFQSKLPSLGVNPPVFLTQTPTFATHDPPYHFPDGNEPSILHIVLCTLWFFNMAFKKWAIYNRLYIDDLPMKNMYI